MKRHSDFDALRAAINAEAVTSFDDLWRYVSPRDLYKRAEMNLYGPGSKRVLDPRILTLRECDQLSVAVGVPGIMFFALIVSSLASSDLQK